MGSASQSVSAETKQHCRPARHYKKTRLINKQEGLPLTTALSAQFRGEGDMNNSDMFTNIEDWAESEMDNFSDDIDMDLFAHLMSESSDDDLNECGFRFIPADFSLFGGDIDNIFRTESWSGHELDEKKHEEPLPSSSPFDTQNFPTSSDDLSLLDLNNILVPPIVEIIVKPPTAIEVYQYSSEENENDEESEEEDETSKDRTYFQVPVKRQRVQKRKYSSAGTDSDEEWNPESVTTNEFSRKRLQMSKTMTTGVSARKPNPVPQRRAPGTKQKITRWIVELLRNPIHNPKVLTWLDEKSGIFQIKDTDAFAKLWGKERANPKMTYEKLSRAMRYSYKNKELQEVKDRLTYRFGTNMVDCRAADSTDPNFEKLRRKDIFAKSGS